VSDAPLVAFENVSKVFRAGGLLSGRPVAAVDRVSLRLERSAGIFAIAGQSGSGKTTLARMLLRLERPSGGRILIEDRPLTGAGALDATAFRRMVQPIFQNPFEAFSLHLTVDSYLFRTAINLGIAEPGAAAERAVEDALRQVGMTLERVRGKFVHQFSGGELQRISIARALIPRPRLIVADEPVSMVDASLRMTIVNLFLEIRRARDVSFIYITHDLSTAYYVADGIAIMNRGRIVERGDPKQVLIAPSDDYTRTLIDAIPKLGQRWAELERGEEWEGTRA
jgi:peptide/nickel transport system ATP-binding protein